MVAKQIEFDGACAQFTRTMHRAYNWKHEYYGAAYSTRLKQAVKEAREACDELEQFLKDNGEWDYVPQDRKHTGS